MTTDYKNVWKKTKRYRHHNILTIDHRKVLIAGLAYLSNKKWLIKFFLDRYSEENIEYVGEITQKRLK